MLGKINKYLEQYIKTYNLRNNPETLNCVRKITKIILDNPPLIEDKYYTYDVDLQTSQKLAWEFLNNVGFNFNDCLDSNMKSININFVNGEELDYNGSSISCVDLEEGNTKVKIVYYNDLTDCYTIIHEMLHAMNTIYENDLAKKHRRNMLTETVSLLGTVEAEKYYLETREEKEFTYNKMDDYYGIYEKALKVDDTLKILDIYLKKGFVSNRDLININPDTVREIIRKEEVQIPFYERYLLAYVLVNYIEKMYDGKKMIKTLNNMIKENTLEETFKNLNLDFNIKKDQDGLEFITDISDYSLKLLELCLNNKEEIKVSNEYKKIHNVS